MISAGRSARTREPDHVTDVTRRQLALPDLGLLVLGLALLVSLLGYAFRGWFSRYTSDDYCTAGAVRALGFLGAQVYWYETWSGRFAYYAVAGAVELAGSGIVQVLPSLALAAWLAVGTWALLPLARDQHWPRPRLSAAALSGSLMLVCLQGAPRLDQALYWQTGMLTYLLPIMLLTAYAGWIAWRVRRGSWQTWSIAEACAGGALLFITGGISETSLSVQLGLMGIATLLAFGLVRSRRYRALPVILTTGLLATILSAVVVVAAPGNLLHEIRVTGSVHTLSELPGALRAGVDFVGLFVRAVQFRARSAVVIVFFLSLSFGFFSAKGSEASLTRRRWYWDVAGIGTTVACGWVLLMAATVPGYFAQAWDPPERSQFVGVWVAAGCLSIVSYLLGRLAARAGRAVAWLANPVHRRQARAAWAGCLVLLAVGPLVGLRETLALASADAAYAAQWDALDATIRARASGGQPVVLQTSLPTHYGFDFIDPDPGAYPDPCVAQFYGIPSIRSER